METVTFYSYKGGTGRSLLLANTAQFLGLAGKRVVALDLDFEAPGLHYKLHIGKPGQRTADIVPKHGVVDYLSVALDGPHPERLSDYLAPVALPEGSGALALMPAGAAPTGEYWRKLTALVRRGVLGEPNTEIIASLLELQLRIENEFEADFLLIDSRTGITELAGLATTLLADKVICLMLDNPESLAGTRAVLRSFGRAVRLKGQDPVEVIAVLSRIPEPDEETERRVIAFLTEHGPSPDETLSLEGLFILPDEPDVAQAEHILLDGGSAGAASDLGQSYLALMKVLAPTDNISRSAAFRRQHAVRAMRAWLTEDNRGNRHRAIAPSNFDDDQVDEGVPMGRKDPRYADLVAFADRQRNVPVLAAEYVEDLDGSDAWRWWQHGSALRCVLLFSLAEDGRLQRRAFTRAGRGSFREVESHWGLAWPSSYTALRDPGDQSIAAHIEAVRAGADDFVGLLVQEWQHASFVTLHGGAPYRPDIARQIVEGLASVEDVNTQRHVLWQTAPDPFERSHRGMREDGPGLERLTERRLHAPLFWRVSAEAKIASASRRGHPLDGTSSAGIDLLADELLGLRFDQNDDLRGDLGRLLGTARMNADELSMVAYAVVNQFRGRELRFDFSTDPPPEVIRRVLLRELLSSRTRDSARRSGLDWDSAAVIAANVLHDPAALSTLLREPDGKRSLVTTNLLGIYDPTACRVTLYRHLLDWTSAAFDIPLRHLENVVFIHETVHAICHLGRDLDGRAWPEFALPSSRDLGFRPSALHEELAQYFTYRLIKRVDDSALMHAFEQLTDHQPEEYQAWRDLRDVPVEQMRARLMRARTGAA